MALKLSIDLQDATYGDLVALVDAARAAGVDNATALELDGSTLTLAVAAPMVGGARRAPRDTSGFDDRVVPTLGENAVRGIMDILTGRQDPPGAHSR
ncbi:hypothetical protein [Corynebacterium urinipleomorphum]|uniref:hypothetical protein n=1 Tax=Corynebacterium urinipleomorphum TaxID=1852380 RepID=UPI000B350695|nr:hypothetical protein [Corynebacterium urinipleomorphum]